MCIPTISRDDQETAGERLPARMLSNNSMRFALLEQLISYQDKQVEVIVTPTGKLEA